MCAHAPPHDTQSRSMGLSSLPLCLFVSVIPLQNKAGCPSATSLRFTTFCKAQHTDTSTYPHDRTARKQERDSTAHRTGRGRGGTRHTENEGGKKEKRRLRERKRAQSEQATCENRLSSTRPLDSNTYTYSLSHRHTHSHARTHARLPRDHTTEANKHRCEASRPSSVVQRPSQESARHATPHTHAHRHRAGFTARVCVCVWGGGVTHSG